MENEEAEEAEEERDGIGKGARRTCPVACQPFGQSIRSNAGGGGGRGRGSVHPRPDLLSFPASCRTQTAYKRLHGAFIFLSLRGSERRADPHRPSRPFLVPRRGSLTSAALTKLNLSESSWLVVVTGPDHSQSFVLFVFFNKSRSLHDLVIPNSATFTTSVSSVPALAKTHRSDC